MFGRYTWGSFSFGNIIRFKTTVERTARDTQKITDRSYPVPPFVGNVLNFTKQQLSFVEFLYQNLSSSVIHYGNMKQQNLYVATFRQQALNLANMSEQILTSARFTLQSLQ
jgi:uncharacterized protein YjbI with pentapeptide repeats